MSSDKPQSKPGTFKALRPYLILGVLLIAADQITKVLAVRFLKGQSAFVLIDGVFELRYLENTGIAWGMFSGTQYIFAACAALVVILILIVLTWIPADRHFFVMKLCLAVLGAGAAGNMIDRILRGYVVDFFYFSLIDFPIFNVADCFVTVSGIILIIILLFKYDDADLDMIFGKKSEKKSADKAD